MENTNSDVGRAGAGSYILAILLPIGGVIAAIVQFARGHVGPGLAVLLTSIVAAFIWFSILASIAVNDATNDLNSYSNCVDKAQTLKQLNACD